MPAVTIELNANREQIAQPIIWRLGKLFNVTSTIERARISEDFGTVQLKLEASKTELEAASAYLKALGLTAGEATGAADAKAQPELKIARPKTVALQIATVNANQVQTPILCRVGKEFDVVINILKGSLDNEEGGALDITLSGELNIVQRAISYLHTTGLKVYTEERSVTDFKNL